MIRLDNVTKSYLTLRGRKVVFRDFSLEIPEGRNVGLIGQNGAGKSTLMRLISAVDFPDSGRITTNGRLSWPVGLKGGLQKTLTGRDNVKFVCRVQGVRKTGMQEKIDFVREFAEIGDYFDQPVSTYSSGMRARLAFGLSMAFDFDYYLIDEVMAVGDASFKQKSHVVFSERLQNAKMILVTHNMKRISRMCEIVVHLHGGRGTVYEDVAEGIRAYQAAGGVDGKRAAELDDDDAIEAGGMADEKSANTENASSAENTEKASSVENTENAANVETADNAANAEAGAGDADAAAAAERKRRRAAAKRRRARAARRAATGGGQ